MFPPATPLAPFLVWGEVLWDRFPSGPILGGAPSNVAYHLAALGVPCALISRVGSDPEGDKAIETLAARGVETTFIERDPVRPTGSVDVEIIEHEARYRLVNGCAWEHIDGCAHEAALSGAGTFVYGTLSQRTDKGIAAFRAALATLPPSCVCVFDPNLRPGHIDERAFEAGMNSATILKLNDHEAAHLAARRSTSRRAGTQGSAAVDWVFSHTSVELIALTHGSAGSTLCARNEPPVRAHGVAATSGGDNVGCGDAYLASLLVGLSQGLSPTEVAVSANTYAAQIASVCGAGTDR